MISKRLKTIADFVESNDSLVDIGCDHGLLSIYLYQKKICKFIIASDKNPNALENAIKNIKEKNLIELIPTILSDGVNDIDLVKYKINTLIIAGMGTNTILKILNNEKCKMINKLLIQSNKEYYELRKIIIKMGYYIKDETIVYDNKKYYLTIHFEKGNKKYHEFDYRWGIIKKENLSYYEFLLDKYIIIYNKIPYKRFILKLRTKILILELRKIINNIKSDS